MSATAEELALAVIVPTLGRPTLEAAVRSAADQDPAPREIVVVVDGPNADSIPAEVVDMPQVRIVVTGGGRGPSGARMDGVRASTAPVVAFLDDDDEWLPGKVAAQLQLFAVQQQKTIFPIVTCRAFVDTGNDRKEEAPACVLGDGEPLASFMFDRNKVLVNGFMFGSSTLLTSRALLEIEPWADSLRLHEDWEWLLRVASRDDVAVVMHPAPLINYFVQAPARSASRPRGGWRDSMAFAEGAGFGRRTRGDFLLCVTAPMALAHGERADAVRVALHAVRTARPGAHAWAVFALQLLVPDRLLGGVAGRLRLIMQDIRRSTSPAGNL